MPSLRHFFALLFLCTLVVAVPARADRWGQGVPALPPSRSFHTLIADSLYNRLLLFGGFRSQTVPTGLSDLWSLDLIQGNWAPVPASGAMPPATWLHAAAFDGDHRRMWVFGGQSSLVRSLHLDSLTWSVHPGGGTPPPVLTGHAMIYDPYHYRLIVFGGNFGNDLYTWDVLGSGWTRIPTDSTFPSPRSFHSFVLRRSSRTAVLYGGVNASGLFPTDAFSFNLDSLKWSPLSLPGAPLEGRAGHVTMSSGDGRRIYFQGGYGLRARWQDVILLNFDSGAWETLQVAGAAPDVDEGSPGCGLQGKLFRFGGRSRFAPGESNTLWKLTLAPNSWSLGDTVPEERYDHVMFRDPLLQQVYVFGGVDARGPLGDLWRYENDPGRWTSLSYSPAPSARSGSSVAVDSVGGSAYLFGGDNGTSMLRDLWQFRFATQTWTSLPVNAPFSRRKYSSLAWDAAHHRLWMFGGYGGSGPLGDLWYRDPDSTVWHQVGFPAGPGPRYLHSMVSDAMAGKLLVYGGSNDTAVNNELWAFRMDSLTWSLLHPSGPGPGPRMGHTSILDLENQLLVYGGVPSTLGAPYNDAWTYDRRVYWWKKVVTPALMPEGRWRHAAVWNPIGRRMRIFGGLLQSGPLNDNWFLELPAGVVDVPSRKPLRPGTLSSPIPNPSRTRTTMRFAVPGSGVGFELAVYDVTGRKVASLAHGSATGATEEASWDGRTDSGGRVAEGVYFARLSGPGGTLAVRKLVRVR